MTSDEKDQSIHFRFLGSHSLSTQLKTIPFIIGLFTGHTIEFSGSTFSLNQDAQKLQYDLQEMHQHQQDLYDIARVFNF